MWTIAKKELKSYFLSPIGYICLAIIISICSLLFFTDIMQLSTLKIENMFSSLVAVITFIIPLLTMKTFAEERKNKTEQLLITSTKSTLSIVLGKFVAISLMIILSEAIMLIYYLIIALLGTPTITTAITNLFGLLLLSMTYISIGILISSLTENQIIAGISTIIVLVINWFLPEINSRLSFLSFIHTFDTTFYLGIISLQGITLYVSTIIISLCITAILLKIRRSSKKVIKIITAILIIIIYIALNIVINLLNIPEIDLTKDKFYSITDQSKQIIKEIQEPVNIYLFGYDESEPAVIIAKKYNQYNSKIYVKNIDINKDKEITQKYSITSTDDMGIVIETQESQKVLSSSDIYTYDKESKTNVNLVEQKITNAIIDVTTKEKQNIYFLSGHGEYTPSSNMTIASTLIYNEAYEVYQLNLKDDGQMPENCDLLIIAAPAEDIPTNEKNEIIKYIQNGGKILWLNNVQIQEKQMPNISEILEQFGIQFENGIILETDLNKTILNNQEYLVPQLSNHKINETINNSDGIMLIDSGKINVASDEELENQKVQYQNLLKTTQTSYLRKDLSITQKQKQENEEQGEFIIAGEFTKQIDDQKQSKMIAVSNAVFASDLDVKVGENDYSAIYIMNNKDFILNSIEYLTNRNEVVRIRKQENIVKYTANTKQDIIIKIVLVILPITILIIGIIVNIKRNKQK